jgi:hypothetical protein
MMPIGYVEIPARAAPKFLQSVPLIFRVGEFNPATPERETAPSTGLIETVAASSSGERGTSFFAINLFVKNFTILL